MKNFVQKLRKNNKGFSLVELIIVIAIMAILIAILAPMYFQYVEDSRNATLETAANEMATMLRAEMAQGDISNTNGAPTGTIRIDVENDSVTALSDIYYRAPGSTAYVGISANSALTSASNTLGELLGMANFDTTSTATSSFTIEATFATGDVTVTEVIDGSTT